MKTLLLLTILTALASHALAGAPAQAWVMFCDDENCSQNCGMNVSINNPGCLNEPNRGSFYVRGVRGANTFSLLSSPSADCPCQAGCAVPFDGTMHKCYSLSATYIFDKIMGESYQFIEGLCPENNCPYPTSKFFPETTTTSKEKATINKVVTKTDVITHTYTPPPGQKGNQKFGHAATAGQSWGGNKWRKEPTGTGAPPMKVKGGGGGGDKNAAHGLTGNPHAKLPANLAAAPGGPPREAQRMKQAAPPPKPAAEPPAGAPPKAPPAGPHPEDSPRMKQALPERRHWPYDGWSPNGRPPPFLRPPGEPFYFPPN